MIKVAFYKGKGTWMDLCVRFWTRSIYSHVELVVFDSGDFPPTIISSSGRDDGVRFKEYSIEKLNSEKWDLIDVSEKIDDESLAYFSVNKLGKRYDYKGILLSQFLPLKRHGKNKYFCSEFCAEALGFSNPHEYSPQDLYTALQQRG